MPFIARMTVPKTTVYEYDGFISCGSTGALLAGGTFIVKRIKNVKRPALMIMAPSLSSPFILMDVGANVDCSVEMLSQFAIMGSAYAKGILGKENPTVALLNIGSEEGKGDKEGRGAAPQILNPLSCYKTAGEG